MFKIVVMAIVAGVIGAVSASAQTSGATGGNGVLEWQVRSLDLHVEAKQSSWTAVSFRVDIKNVGKTPVVIALMNPGATVRMDGLTFDRTNGPTGIVYCGNPTVAGCDRLSEDFTRVRPGQTVSATLTLFSERNPRDVAVPTFGDLSGQLYMRDLDNGQSSRESFTLNDIKVSNNLRR